MESRPSPTRYTPEYPLGAHSPRTDGARGKRRRAGGHRRPRREPGGGRGHATARGVLGEEGKAGAVAVRGHGAGLRVGS